MSLIALDASGSLAGLAVLGEDGTVEGSWTIPLRPGLIETLPPLLQKASSGRHITDIAVCTGPGSFTGLRTSIALAQGFAAAANAVLWGIPVWDAYGAALPDLGRPLWVAIRARRGRLFLLRDGFEAESYADDDLPLPTSPIAIAGEEAGFVAALLKARGAEDVALTDLGLPTPASIGHAARRRKQAGDKPAAALPVYVDAPEAKRPAAGLRPFPA